MQVKTMFQVAFTMLGNHFERVLEDQSHALNLYYAAFEGGRRHNVTITEIEVIEWEPGDQFTPNQAKRIEY